MSKNFYYIKIKSFEYDEPDWFVCESSLSNELCVFRTTPLELKIFTRIENAVSFREHLVNIEHADLDITRAQILPL